MTPPVTRATAGGRALLDLRAKARRESRPTEELLVLYLLEAFLRRLAESEHRERFVLKGGVLLAAFGDRRPTRDIDFQARQVANDADTLWQVICQIAALPADDGVVFDTASVTTEIIREDGGYQGVRVRTGASIDRARLRFAVDVNVGDPIEPGPQEVCLPTLLGQPTLRLLGYPLAMVLAEKVVTALERGSANTRWRDFADVWTLSRRQECSGDELQAALRRVAQHRGTQLEPLLPALDALRERAQRRWATWRDRSGLAVPVPEAFTEVLDDLVAFTSAPLTGQAESRRWNPQTLAWTR